MIGQGIKKKKKKGGGDTEILKMKFEWGPSNIAFHQSFLFS